LTSTSSFPLSLHDALPISFGSLESSRLLRGSSLSSGLNFQAPRIVVRGADSGAGFAVGVGPGCVGAAVIGPDGDCALDTSPAKSPSVAIVVNLVSLNK